MHHGKIEHHVLLLLSLHTMVASLQLDASAYGAENWVVIVELNYVVKDLHTLLTLVNLGSDIFTRRHGKEAINQHISTLEY